MPVKAVSSKLLAQRWDEEAYLRHMGRTKNASSTLDTTAPKKYPHLLLSLKKLLIEEERQTRYHNENKVLMDKIRDIVKGHGTIERQQNQQEKKSLNTPYMNKVRERIRKENLLMLRRLKGVVSTMTHTQWESDYRMHLSYKDMLSRTTKDYKYRLPPISRAAKVESKAEGSDRASAEGSRPTALPPVEEEKQHSPTAAAARQKSPAVARETPDVTSDGRTEVSPKGTDGSDLAPSTVKESADAPDAGPRGKGVTRTADNGGDIPKKSDTQVVRKKKTKAKVKAAAAPSVAEGASEGDAKGASSTPEEKPVGGREGRGSVKREPTETSFLPRIDDRQGLVSRKNEAAETPDDV